MKISQVIILVFSLLLSSHVIAGTVKKVIVKKRIVIIDEGTNAGIGKKSKICFYNASGKAVGCGLVIKAKTSSSFVKVSKKRIKRIKKGMESRLKGGSSGKGTTSGPVAGTNFKAFWDLAIKPPTTYQLLSYEKPTTNATTLWKQDQEAPMTFFGFGAEFGFAAGGFKMGVGLRLRSFREFTVQSNYDSDSANFAEANTTATAYGLWYDFYFLDLSMAGGMVLFDIGVGLDIDMSTVILRAALKNDDTGSETLIYDIKSSLNTISLRIPMPFALHFDPIALFVAPVIMLPLSASGSFSAAISDTQVSFLNGTTGEEDVKAQLGHKKNSFALELLMGGYIAF